MSLVAACTTFVGHTFDGRKSAFIYVWFSLVERFLYIGQSNNRLGSFGRALQHLGIGGTLRDRAEAELGMALEEVRDLTLVSFQLPDLPDLTSVESSYREAVEFLVQKGINERRLELGRGFKVISVIRYSDAASLEYVRQIAHDIVDETIRMIASSAGSAA